MADGGGTAVTVDAAVQGDAAAAVMVPTPLGIHNGDDAHFHGHRASDFTAGLAREETSATSPRIHVLNPFSRQHTSLDLDDYFVSLPESQAYA